MPLSKNRKSKKKKRKKHSNKEVSKRPVALLTTLAVIILIVSFYYLAIIFFQDTSIDRSRIYEQEISSENLIRQNSKNSTWFEWSVHTLGYCTDDDVKEIDKLIEQNVRIKIKIYEDLIVGVSTNGRNIISVDNFIANRRDKIKDRNIFLVTFLSFVILLIFSIFFHFYKSKRQESNPRSAGY